MAKPKKNLKYWEQNKELIPIFIEHAKTYYEDREILFKNKHELIHYFRQRKKEISVNDQTFKDFKGKLEAQLTEILKLRNCLKWKIQEILKKD